MEWPATKRLVQKQYDGLGAEVKGYFEDLGSGKLHQKGGQTAVDNLWVNTVRFLTECCYVVSDSASLDVQVERAIESCCHGYSQLCRVTTINDAKLASSLKTILYIVSKLVGKAKPSTFLTVSDSVLTTLKLVPDLERKSQICDFIPMFYSFLWNAAITLERRSEVTPLEVYELRLASLRVLAQHASKQESCLDKMILALSVFEYQSKQKCADTREASLGKEPHHEEKEGSGPQKSKSSRKAQGKKGAAPSSRSSPHPEGLQTQQHVFSLVLVALEDVLRSRKVSEISLLKLILAVYNVLSGSKLMDRLGELETKVTTVIGNGQGDASSQIITYVLKPVWDMIRIVEVLCGESAHIQCLSKTDLTTWLNNTLSWCQQQNLRTSDAEERCFVELFHWFLKQFKSRKFGTDFLQRTDDLVQLLSLFQEAQKFFQEKSVAMVTGGADGGSPSQEWQEKVRKTYLDAHRCWLTLYHKAIAEYSSAPKKHSGIKMLQNQAADQLAAYSAAIDRTKHCPTLELSERYYLGSVCLRLGHLFYNQNQDETAIPFYDLACRQLVLWCHSDPQNLSTRIKEVSLMKLYNCLSLSQMKVGSLDDAMATVIQAISLGDQEASEDFTCLMKTWLKLKKMAMREGGEKMDQRLTRSLVEEENCAVETLCHYLLLELTWFLRGARLWSAEGVVLKRLYEASPAGKDKDVYHFLLLQFDVLTQHPLKTDRQEVEQCLHKITTTYPDMTVLQMEVLLVQFCLHVKDKLEKPVAEPSEEDNRIMLPVIGTHDKMIGEGEKVIVRAALNTWTAALNVEGVDSILDQMQEVHGRIFMDMLMTVADILLACREFLLQLEVLAVVKQIRQRSAWEDSQQDMDIGILDALAGLGVEDLPQGMSDIVTRVDLMTKEAGCQDKGAESLRLTLISLYLQVGKVEKAKPLLNALHDRGLKSEMGSLLRGKYSRLLSQYLMTMSHSITTDDYLLTVIQNAYRTHFSFFTRGCMDTGETFHQNGQSGNESLWRKLVELLESTMFLGRVYRHVGDGKRAKCYLKEGLALSSKFGLLKWSTKFGLEITELFCDMQCLPAMVNTLTATYVTFSTLEPPAHSKPCSEPPSKAVCKSKPSSSKHKQEASHAKLSDVTAEDLVKECQKVYDHNRTLLCEVGKKGQMVENAMEVRFWQKLRSYVKMEEEKRTELHRDVEELAAVILAWCTSLVHHPSHCWCLMCIDVESQRLALTMTKTSIKAVHAYTSAENHFERFFNVLLTQLKKLDPSKRVMQVLQSMQVACKSDTLKCKDVSLMHCIMEVCVLLVESTLHHSNLPQAMAHLKVGLKAVRFLPPHPDTWLIKSHLAHLQAVCVYLALSSRQPEGKEDSSDVWCWLSEAQLEVHIRNKLEQLRIKGHAEKKVDKVSANEDVGSSSHSLGGKEPTDDTNSENSSTEHAASSHLVTGKVNICDQNKRGSSKDHADLLHVVSDNGDTDKIIEKSGSEDMNVSSHSVIDKHTASTQPKTSTYNRTAVLQSSSQKSRSIPSNQLSDPSSSKALPKPTHSVLKSSNTCHAGDTNRTVNRKETKSTAQRSSAQTKMKQGKDGAIASWRDSFEDATSNEADPVLFMEESVATRLFSEDSAANITDKNGMTPFLTPCTLKHSDHPETPSSLIQQTLSFTSRLSNSGDEFQPITPKSTPRHASWLTRKHGQSKGVQSKAASRKGTVTDVTYPSRTDFSARSGTGKRSSKQTTAPVESLESKFVKLAVSDDRDKYSAVSLPPAKTKRSTKSTTTGKRVTPKAKSVIDHDMVSIEALQQDMAKLDLSREAVDTITDVQTVRADPPEEPPVDYDQGKEPSADYDQDEVNAVAQKGKRGRGQKATEKTDRENTGCRTGTGRRQARGLNPRSNIPSETSSNKPEDKRTQVLPPVVEEPVSVRNSSRKRGRPQKEESVVKQTGKTQPTNCVKNTNAGKEGVTSRGGRKPREIEKVKEVEPPSRGRRAAGPKTAKDKTLGKKATHQTVPDRELVRAGDHPQEPEVHRDVFEFMESDEETQSSKTSATKGKKGHHMKSLAAKAGAGRSTKQPVTKSALVKSTDRHTKLVTSKNKAVSHVTCAPAKTVSRTAAPSSKKPSTTTKNPLSESPGRHLDPKQLPATKLTSSKEASFTSTVTNLHTDLTSIETLRTSALKTAETMSVVSDSQGCASYADGGRCKGNKNDDRQELAQHTESVWHLESLWSYFQNREKYIDICDDVDGDENIDSLVVEDWGVISPEREEEVLCKVQARLMESTILSQHFPHVNLFSESSKLVAKIMMDQRGDPWKIAALLSESASVSLRHQFLAYFHKSIRLQELKEGDTHRDGMTGLKEDLKELLFPWDLHRHREVVQSIPQGWTVCQFSVVDNIGSQVLLLTRLTCDEDPLTVELPRFSDDRGQSIYFGFKDILKMNDEAQKIKDNALWWRHRAALEARLVNTLEGMEKHWLGCWKGMLAGQTSDTQYNMAMATCAGKLVKLLHTHLACRCPEGRARQILELMQHTKDLPTVLSCLLQRDDIVNNAKLISTITSQVLEVMPKVTTPDLPVVLILDKQLANFPLEQLSVMKNQQVTRVPSLSLLHHLLRRHTTAKNKGTGITEKGGWNIMEHGIKPTSVFYLTNPDGDLAKSQQLLGSSFESYEKWEGIAGSVPTKEQYEQALSQFDMFVYSGHGSGCKYFSVEDILKVKCRTVPLLFGCSSVRMDITPRMDPDAYFFSYLMAGSPCVLGNLWDVTDRDIDEFGLEIFNLWLKEKGEEPLLSLASLVQQARSVCRMPMLNGGAPVLYGLPVPLIRPSR